MTNTEQKNLNEKVKRDFKLSTLALKNKNTVYLLTLVLMFFGINSYRNLPKELFPDITFPYVMVQTTYPGNPPLDIENLITRPIEKEIESINGIKEISSTSAQDASMIFIEFNPNIELKTALQDVRDAVDNAKSELPNDLLMDPLVMDLDFSEFPIVNVNLSGDYSIDELKEFGEILQDRIEGISEISKVYLQGVNEREIKINVDLHKLQSFQMSFTDIENAIAFENMSISGGELKVGGTRRSIRTLGEFTTIEEMENIVVKHEDGDIVYLKDVADVIDGFEESSSVTRLDGQPVVSLQVVKKGGENLLSATKQIEEILDVVEKANIFPDDLNITVTNDQSDMVKKQLNDLENSMVMSVIFVILVLFFFLGTRNALFVGLAIPMSMFLSFAVLRFIDYRVNMIVLFSLILALGMLVDNAIVVVENIHRFVSQGYKKWDAARQAVGEIAVPIIASTATTLAAFFPLVFWDSIVGEFMKYLPVTLIIVLSSSLFVALILIPVFSSTFIKRGGQNKKPNKKLVLYLNLSFAGIALISFLTGAIAIANVFLFAIIIGLLNYFLLNRLGQWFQHVFLVKLENVYVRLLSYSLRRYRPVYFLTGTFFLLVFTVLFMFVRKPDILFFPNNDPNYINVMATLPVGTDIITTDSLAMDLEKDVNQLIEPYKDIIESVLTNVGEGAKGEEDISMSKRLNKCLVTVSFVDFAERDNVNTSMIMKMLSDSLIHKYAGVEFTIEKDRFAPPSGKEINIEVSGKDYEELITLADTMQFIIEQENIDGIEGLKMDLNTGNPEMIITIDRDKARRLGMSTAQIASTIRTALFGKEISDFKVGEDEYPIQLRLKENFRYSIPALMNQIITFRNSQGVLITIPISSVASYRYSTTYNSVKRIDLDRVITVYSNVIEGYNANNVNQQIKTVLSNYDMPEGYEYRFTGEQQDQAESMAFLNNAFLIALALIMIILVTQFNSIVRTLIILASILFSTIGVFGGIATFKMDFVIIMTGVGIVSLAGIVVNNAIVLVDYIELLKARKRKEMGLNPDEYLPVSVATECIIQAGRTRLRPVLLTAITTVLGLIPLAIGLNIDFEGLLTSYRPNFFIGGDMVLFWGPMAWTVIFGLTFSTFLTLVIVPAMYRITTILQKRLVNMSVKMTGNGQKIR